LELGLLKNQFNQ
jgi:hypothetical protein